MIRVNQGISLLSRLLVTHIFTRPMLEDIRSSWSVLPHKSSEISVESGFVRMTLNNESAQNVKYSGYANFEI